MKKIKTIGLTLAILLAIGLQSAMAQSTKVESMFKNYINDVVEKVKQTESADEKRELLNDSFDKLISAYEKAEAISVLSEDEKLVMDGFRLDIIEKQNELNGLSGYAIVPDDQLNNFADFVQQDFEQASPFLYGFAFMMVFYILFMGI